MIISEYITGTRPKRETFPIRNRIISGISDSVVIVEAKAKSGSLITADLALEQNRDLFVVPGNLDNKNSEGTNNLIKEGAPIITSPIDIIETLQSKNIDKNLNLLYDVKEAEEQ